MKAFLPLLGILLALSACGGGGGGDGEGVLPEGPVVAVADFVHTTTSGNIDAIRTLVDHPVTNDNPDAVLFVTHNWNPGGGYGANHDHPLGVRYDDTIGRWTIVNQDIVTMETGRSFNVSVASGIDSAWTHLTTAANTTLDLTVLDDPALNGVPGARALVTRNLTPIGSYGLSSDAPFGLYYDGSQWTIFHEDASTMGTSFRFNVRVLPSDGSALQHTATAGNTEDNWTAISHPDAGGNPDALVQVTQGYGGGGIRNDHDVGVFYDGLHNRWAIFNEDGAPMPLGAVFYVRVLP